MLECFHGYTLFIKGGYGYLSYKGKSILIHRVVYLLIRGVISDVDNPLDHINQNRLDNRIENLRLVTRSKNGANRKLKPNKSGYRGVYPSGDKWIAQISINGKVRALGRFRYKEEAALAYNKAAQETWGDDAEINIITGSTPASRT